MAIPSFNPISMPVPQPVRFAGNPVAGINGNGNPPVSRGVSFAGQPQDKSDLDSLKKWLQHNKNPHSSKFQPVPPKDDISGGRDQVFLDGRLSPGLGSFPVLTGNITWQDRLPDDFFGPLSRTERGYQRTNRNFDDLMELYPPERLFAADQKGLRVLDVGAGQQNKFVEFLRLGGVKAIGMDIEPYKGTARGREACFAQGAAESLPFADASFDMVYSTWSVLSYKSDASSEGLAEIKPKALAEMFRVLRPGGILRLSPVEYTEIQRLARQTGQKFTIVDNGGTRNVNTYLGPSHPVWMEIRKEK